MGGGEGEGDRRNSVGFEGEADFIVVAFLCEGASELEVESEESDSDSESPEFSSTIFGTVLTIFGGESSSSEDESELEDELEDDAARRLRFRIRFLGAEFAALAGGIERQRYTVCEKCQIG